MYQPFTAFWARCQLTLSIPCQLAITANGAAVVVQPEGGGSAKREMKDEFSFFIQSCLEELYQWVLTSCPCRVQFLSPFPFSWNAARNLFLGQCSGFVFIPDCSVGFPREITFRKIMEAGTRFYDVVNKCDVTELTSSSPLLVLPSDDLRTGRKSSKCSQRSFCCSLLGADFN